MKVTNYHLQNEGDTDFTSRYSEAMLPTRKATNTNRINDVVA